MANTVQRNSAFKPEFKARGRADLPKPQLNFKEKINNDPNPFLHKLTEKPHSLNPLSLQQRDSHPYEFELKNFTPDTKFLDVKNDVPLFQPLSETPLIMVDSNEGFQHLLQDLLLQTVIAVDLEHHDSRSYQGITCLIQISTTTSDYIIDTLKLWDQLQPLNQVFCNPNILKIFQAAQNDIMWLQRDFGIYVVNLFDTHQAASLLQIKIRSLSSLLKRYCQIHVNKSYQLADWRIRPLPEEMLNYAREDTHYLIYIYERLKQDLNSIQSHDKLDGSLKKQGSHSEFEELKESKSSQTTPNGTGVNRIFEVWKNSRSICLKRYMVPPKERYLKVYNKLIQTNKKFNQQQLYALRELCAWRDGVARDEDESPNFIVPNYMLVQIIHHLPKHPRYLPYGFSNAPFVQQHLPHVREILLKASKLDISSSATNETRATSETRQHDGKNRKSKTKCAIALPPTKKNAIEDVSSIVKGSLPVKNTSRGELIGLACDKNKKNRSRTRKGKPNQSEKM